MATKTRTAEFFPRESRPFFCAPTALAAILGLLPAAVATKVGSQSQRPLAIVVVGGMLMTLMLFNLVPLLYSFYGKRTPLDTGPGVGH